MNNNQNLLTVEMAADYLHCHPETVRRMIRRGELKAVKFRKFWRVPIEGLRRVENAVLDAPASTSAKVSSDPSAAALAILAGLDSDNPQERNAAILVLAQADEQTSTIVEAEVARGVAEYSGPEDDWSDWRALDSEPFSFPEEAEAEEGAQP